MSQLDGMEAFVAVADAGSITAGAELLGMPRATLSRQVSRLEASLGVLLLHRSTRTVSLTAAGETFYGMARRVVDDAQAARRAVASLDGKPRGLLRFSVPGDLDEGMSGLLVDFLEQYPEVELEVVATSRYVDLVAEGFDAALRAGGQLEGAMVARRLAAVEQRLYASEGYLAERGVPARVEDLADHDCLCMFARGMLPQTHWPLIHGGQVAVSGRLSSNSLAILETAIRRGMGIGMLPWAPKGLVPVLGDLVGGQGQMSVVYPERTLLPPKVRALVDFLVERMPALVENGLGRR